MATLFGSLISALENESAPAHRKAPAVGAVGSIVFPSGLIPSFSLEKLDAYIDEMERTGAAV